LPSELKKANRPADRSMVKIAVDAMGGDHAPGVVVEGALRAAQEFGLEVVLVGQKAPVERELRRHAAQSHPVAVIQASEVIAMNESPSSALRKKDSSMRVAFEMMKRGEVEAVVSAGNSGAMMATGMLVVGTLARLVRPAILVVVPTLAESTVIIDAGANVYCKPRHLVQFGLMGSIYADRALGIANPRVGLLSNGEEEEKGNDLTRAASEILSQSPVNYIGYVEGRDIFNGKAHVIVCDGFTGNITLKAMEGVASFAGDVLKSAFQKNLPSRLAYLMSRKSLQEAYRRFDYAEYGGAPLLGLDGVAIVAHGGSSSRAIKNAIRIAAEAVSHDVNHHIISVLGEVGALDGGKPETFPRKFWQRIKSKIETFSERSTVEKNEEEQKGGRNR
jgi:glycerol-3-phosphate acyltransferase PlsX